MRLAVLVTAALLVWPLQYFIVVPAVLAWRLTILALRLGAWGLVLLFFPVVGWALLAYVALVRRPDHDAEWLAIYREQHGLKPRSVLRPWLIDRTRSTT